MGISLSCPALADARAVERGEEGGVRRVDGDDALVPRGRRLEGHEAREEVVVGRGLCRIQPLVWVVLTKLENSRARSHRSRFG